MITTKDCPSSVLVLENDPLLRRAIVDVFELAGMKSFSVANGRSGVEILRTYWDEIDVLVFDLRLPDLEASQALAKLHAIKPSLKVIVSTGYEHCDVVKQLAGQRWHSFLQKPYTPEALVDSVTALSGDPAPEKKLAA